ncbi:MAG: DUF763 domain-containing protein [Candidatus Aminicenantia bacterium]
MMRSGYADVPLDYGRCPPWLFKRMKRIGKAITEVIILEFGRDEFLKRISNPFFFQSLGCLMAFDWNSSGLTTTTCGALKEALSPDLGVVALGGKGRASRRTPQEIWNIGNVFNLSTQKIEELEKASRLAAKVDSAGVQDSYTLYHHSFFVTEDGKWSVIQQGMRTDIGYARRYHWIDEKVKSFVREPHLAICCDTRGKTLNMVARKSEETQKASVDLSKEKPKKLIRLIMDKKDEIDLKRYYGLVNAYEFQPRNYEEMLLVKGMGPKTVRALALLSNLLYGTEISWRDPAKYAFAHGGKDGYPWPVDRKTYDKSIEILRTAVDHAKLGRKDKLNALKKLKDFGNI